MIKLKRGAVERLQLLCIAIKERGYELQSMLEEATKYKSPYKRESSLKEIYATGLSRDTPFFNFEDLMFHLREALEGTAHPDTSHHASLIDVIVEIIDGPYARNSLSGKGLASLRRAVLFPDEMAKVAAAVRKEAHCGMCSHTFNDREACTVSVDGSNCIVFYCVRCVVPVYAACSADPKCDKVGEVDTKILQKIFGKAHCPEHQLPNKKAPEISFSDAQTAAINAAAGRMRFVADQPIGQAFILDDNGINRNGQ